MAKKSNEEVKPPSSLVALARQYFKQKADIKKLDARKKEMNKDKSLAEKKLIEAMKAHRIESFRVKGLSGFRTEGALYPNVTDKEALYGFLRKDKKLRVLLTETVPAGKLKSLCKELMEEGDDLPPGVDPYITTEIRTYK